MAYYLGIDGGGTKTRCLLADETTVLAKAMTGGSNIVRLGEKQAREALHTVVHAGLRHSQYLPQSDLRHLYRRGRRCAARDRHEDSQHPRRAISTPANIEVVGDTEIALEAAFGAGPGVIAIAGTGSIVYGRDAAGHTARAGGWGFAISDEGSGHWIGRRAISAILNARDQGLETALTALLLQAWKLRTIDELVQQANSTPPPDFPRLFPIVLRAADEGDSIARDLLADAGVRLANLAAIVMRRLAPHAAAPPQAAAVLPVAMTGSVFRQSAVVRQIFYNTLQESFSNIDVRQDLVDPVEGALARAKRR
jgi:glucosamine kinase